MTIAKQIYAQLSAPFSAKDIQWRVGSTTQDKLKGTALAYIDGRAVIDRLNEVFGIDGWTSSFSELSKGGILCTLSVKIGDTWISKTDGANFSDIEAIKGGISDALKRAAVHLGVGRYLYDLDTQWVELNNGKYIKNPPMLPDWALPADEKGKQRTQTSSAPQQSAPQVQQPAQDFNPATFVFSGGKYTGMALAQVPKDYLEWIVDKSKSNQDMKDMIKKFLDSSPNTDDDFADMQDPFSAFPN